MHKLAIIGLGLMGGSLGLAARRRGLADEVCGYARREANRQEALAAGAVDTVCETPADAIRGAELIVVCLPVYAICDIVESCRDRFEPGCVVTDVGSTKAEIMATLTPLFDGIPATFIGSHPIAGSDAAGMTAARDDLYDDAMVVITPPGQPEANADRVVDFWQTLGAKTAVMPAERHDAVMAGTSHLPHLVAAMLVDTVCRHNDVGPYCGTGFRDTTRVAGGSEEIWHDIIKSNQTAVLAELDAFSDVVNRVRSLVRDSDFASLRTFLADTMTARRALEKEAPDV